MAYTKGTLAGDFIEGVRADVNGLIAVGVVDMTNALAMDTFSARKDFDPDVASANMVEVIEAQQQTMRALRQKDTLREIFVTLDSQVHLLTLSKTGKALFYIVADAHGANLSMLRSVIRTYAKGI